MADEQDQVAAARSDFDRAIQRYLVVSTDPGLRQLWSRLAGEVAGLDALIVRVQSDVGEPPTDQQVHQTVDRVDQAAQALIEANAQRSHDLAQSIEAMRARSTRLAYGLDTLSVVLAISTAMFTLRIVRRYEAILARHRRSAEQRADELEQFAGRVAHDIKGPLTAVGLSVQTAARRTSDEQTVRASLQRAQTSLQRVQAIIDGLLAFARAGARPEPSDRSNVAKVLDGLLDELQPLATSAGVELGSEQASELVVMCSTGVLTSLVSNLLRNAIKYMGERPVRRVVARVIVRGSMVRVEVQDTGPGVAAETARRLFEPYVRGPGATQPGIGLGLATVRRLAESHGGRVGVDSTLGQGSVFWFEIPRAFSQQESQGLRPLTTT
jgi:signal transduction histidine kinase